MGEIQALAQYLANGLYFGSDYLLLALSITLIFGIMEIGDVAQGGVFALGTYVAYAVVVLLGLPYGLALIAGPAAGAGFSTLIGRGIYQRLRAFGIGPTFIGAVSLLIAIQSGLAILFGEGARTVPSPFGVENVTIGPISLFGHKLFAIGVSVVLALALWYALRASQWGKAVRAITQNREAAALAGIKVGRITLLGFAIAGGLAGLVGAVTAPVAPFTPFTGRLAIIKAFAVSRIARGSVRAVIGLALLLGIAESLTGAYLSPEYTDLLPFGLLILFMLLNTEAFGPEEHLTKPQAGPLKQAPLNMPINRSIGGLALIALLALPLLLSPPSYVFHLLIVAGILAICVTSSDLLRGFTGLPSLAQGALWGVGAYTSALLMMRLDFGPLAALIGALAMSMIIGAFVGSLGVRAGRHWTLFTFITTVFATLVALSWDGLTGGPTGLTGVPMISVDWPILGEVTLNPLLGRDQYYGLVALMLLGVLAAKSRLTRSWFGLALLAIREDEGLARSVGIPIARYKVAVFTVSATLAGLAGFLYAHYVSYLHPELFNLVTSYEIIMMNYLGGSATLLGPVVAPLAVTVVDELTRPINAYIAQFVFTILLIIVLLYLPDGLVGGSRRLLASITSGRAKRRRRLETEPSSSPERPEEAEP